MKVCHDVFFGIEQFLQNIGGDQPEISSTGKNHGIRTYIFQVYGKLFHAHPVHFYPAGFALAEFRKSTDVGDKPLSKERFKGLEKKLLLDMTTLGIHIDNIEGVCFGPRLANGKLSLLFISENNFNKHQVTQLLLFQID